VVPVAGRARRRTISTPCKFERVGLEPCLHLVSRCPCWDSPSPVLQQFESAYLLRDILEKKGITIGIFPLLSPVSCSTSFLYVAPPKPLNDHFGAFFYMSILHGPTE